MNSQEIAQTIVEAADEEHNGERDYIDVCTDIANSMINQGLFTTQQYYHSIRNIYQLLNKRSKK